MRTSTIAAVTAAAFLGLGSVGSAMAGTDMSGFADVNWDVYSGDNEEGVFRASGEVDLVNNTDGAIFRADFDLNNCHNSSPGADLPTGTDPTGALGCGTGVDIEQINAALPVADMATVTAGIFNSFHGLEGQDATDYDFAANGLLWNFVPSNLAGGMVEVTPIDMVAVKLGFINRWTDLAQVQYLTSGTGARNDVIAGVSVMPMEGVGVNLSYLTDATEVIGDELDINATISMVENLVVSAEYLMADPATSAGGAPTSLGGLPSGFDNGYGLTASYDIGKIRVAGRYEAATFEGTGPDTTAGSASVAFNMAENCLVRVDFTSVMVDKFDNNDTVTIQLVHGFGGSDGMM